MLPANLSGQREDVAMAGPVAWVSQTIRLVDLTWPEPVGFVPSPKVKAPASMHQPVLFGGEKACTKRISGPAVVARARPVSTAMDSVPRINCY